jgi:hypothetical protein
MISKSNLITFAPSLRVTFVVLRLTEFGREEWPTIRWLIRVIYSSPVRTNTWHMRPRKDQQESHNSGIESDADCSKHNIVLQN